MTTYRDPTKHWSNDGYTKKSSCERCASIKKLVVHHKNRDRANNKPSNLETLCQLCHIQEHKAEIAVSQRNPEVNKRRGAAISKARTGKEYPKTSEALKAMWQTDAGNALREKHRSAETLLKHSEAAKKLMNDPGHLARRKAAYDAKSAEEKAAISQKRWATRRANALAKEVANG